MKNTSALWETKMFIKNYFTSPMIPSLSLCYDWKEIKA